MEKDILTMYEELKDAVPTGKGRKGDRLKEWCDKHGEVGQMILKNFTGINYDRGVKYDLASVNRGCTDNYIWKCCKCGEIYISKISYLTRNNKRGVICGNCPRCREELKVKSSKYGSLYDYCISRD